jgi:hypothetical protein
MARIRTVKPDFFRSPDTAKADFPVRIFYQAMWCWADDFGVGETNINGLLGFAFPDDDGFTAQDVRRFCADVAQHFDVTFYEVSGRHFYAIPSWEKHQKLERRAERRKNPPPDHPDAVPDLRFHPCADSAPDIRRELGAETVLEQGNGKGNAGRGSGNFLSGATQVSHQSADDVAPSQKCPRHLNVTNPPDCGGCASASREHKRWVNEQKAVAEQRAQNELSERRQRKLMQESCPRCEGTNTYEDDNGDVRKCSPHQEAQHA